MSKPIAVAILGATGYGGGELLRLLTLHPQVQVISLTSTSEVGAHVADLHPHLRGFYEGLTFTDGIDLPRLLEAEYPVIFAGLPHGHSGAAVFRLRQQIHREDVRFIDLSGDLRLRDAELHERYYAGAPFESSLRREVAYGLPELGRDAIRSARIIANPGCLASAAILSLAPLAAHGVGGAVVCDAKTGSSGAGRQLKDTTHHPTRHADFRAYKPLAHQHEPEILQAWGDPHSERIALSFVPQSMDTARGIFVTSHVTLPEATTLAALRALYEQFYADTPFVRLVADSPTLQDVIGSNFCDIALACRGRQVIAMAALDNLVKGMAGTAIQNMNIMCGLPETTGLWFPSIRPA